jgi:hypothetical protein
MLYSPVHTHEHGNPMPAAKNAGVSVAGRCSAGSMSRTARNRSRQWSGLEQSNVNRIYLMKGGESE